MTGDNSLSINGDSLNCDPRYKMLAAVGPTGAPVLLTANADGSLQFGGAEYQTVAASQSNVQLGATGAVGDYLGSITVIPATTSPAALTITDGNGSAITLFAGGATSVADLKPFTITLGLKARNTTTPGWKITTGANMSVVVRGDFT